MSAEYDGKVDRGSDGVSKSFKILPRPLRDPADQIRALNLTGDPTGVVDVSFDDGMWWQGLDALDMRRYEAEEQAMVDRFSAIDQAFYD